MKQYAKQFLLASLSLYATAMAAPDQSKQASLIIENAEQQAQLLNEQAEMVRDNAAQQADMMMNAPAGGDGTNQKLLNQIENLSEELNEAFEQIGKLQTTVEYQADHLNDLQEEIESVNINSKQMNKDIDDRSHRNMKGGMKENDYGDNYDASKHKKAKSSFNDVTPAKKSATKLKMPKKTTMAKRKQLALQNKPTPQ